MEFSIPFVVMENLLSFYCYASIGEPYNLSYLLSMRCIAEVEKISYLCNECFINGNSITYECTYRRELAKSAAAGV